MRCRVAGWVIACLASCLAPRVHACSIPVFRYALERWDLSQYEVILFQKGPTPVRELADVLAELGPGHKRGNFDLLTCDVDAKIPAGLQAVWEKLKNGTVPHLAVRQRTKENDGPLLWHADATVANLRLALDSPMRRQLVKHLAEGDTSVLLLVAGSDPKANAETEAMLRKQAKVLQGLIKLPMPKDDGGPKLLLSLPLKVSLPVVVLPRDDAKEAAFLAMLLGAEEDLAEVKGPILLPIFGRGRMLGSLFGKDLTSEQVFRAVSFVCKECSCQVKELNPGIDLLMPVHWPDLLRDVTLREAKKETK